MMHAKRNVAGLFCAATLIANVPTTSFADGGDGISSAPPKGKLVAGDPAKIAAKEADAKRQTALISKDTGNSALLRSLPTEPSAGAPNSRWVWWSGETLEQEKRYTCGPASLRNMIKQMTHAEPPSEAALARALGTTQSGTSIYRIASHLNANYKAYGGWKVVPGSQIQYTEQLLGIFSSTIGNYGQPVIQGVVTKPLPFWRRHSFNHFNVSYYYNLSDWKIHISDPYNRDLGGGANPYGFHEVDATQLREAVEPWGVIQ